MLQGVVVLVDARHPAQKLDIAMLASLQQLRFLRRGCYQSRCAQAFSKAKKLKVLRNGLMVPKVIPYSSVTKEGVDALCILIIQVTIMARKVVDSWTKKAKNKAMLLEVYLNWKSWKSLLRGMKRFVDLGCAPALGLIILQESNPRASVVGIDIRR